VSFRSDITVDWTQSPRIITVAAPSTELTIQDLHDTLRVLSEQPWEGLAYPKIINTFGKQDLGGGVAVGLTSVLLDAVLAFEARRASTTEGTITTGDTAGITLTDTGADFVSDGVVPGAWIFNKTDGSKCSVRRVVSANVLLTDGLGDGTDDQFDISDAYEVQNITQCEVSGGNLTAVDDLGVSTESILPTAGTQVIRTSAASATSSEQDVAQLIPLIDRNADLIETQRPSHTWQNGEWFYVDPANGDTIANGADGSRTSPLSTVTEALSLVTDSKHSLIFLLAGEVGGPTTMTEDVVVNKRYTFIRGPGRDFIWNRSGSGHTIEVTAEGVELTGFQVATDITGSGSGIRVNSAPFCKIHHVWVNETRGSGIEVSNSDHAVVEDCAVINAGQGGSGHGIQFSPAGGTSSHNRVTRCHIDLIPGDGIRLNGVNVDNAIIEDCSVHGCTGWGINIIEANDTIAWGNLVKLNGSGNIQDTGTRTILENNEQWSTEAQLALVGADAGNMVILDDDDATPFRTYDVTDVDGNAILNSPGVPARRSKGV
jgi:hypothetical protein